MANNTYGLDLGTYELKIYDQMNDKIWKTKNAIAVKNEKTVLAVGDKAYAMREKTPDFIRVFFPMQNGVISDFDLMQKLLYKLFSVDEYAISSGNYLIAVPADITEVEKKAYVDLLGYSKVKIQSAKIVERGIAEAIGMGIPVQEEKGTFIIDVGGESCELFVMSQGGVVLKHRLKTGGVQLDMAVINKIRHKEDFLIGQTTAENVRKHFGISDQNKKENIMVAGKDLLTGLPKMKSVSADTIKEAIDDSLGGYISAIETMLKRIPPDIRREIDKNGIYLSGGLSNMDGLRMYFQEKLQTKITVAQDPELCVVKGLREIIRTPDYEKLTYSMTDENYRWLS